MLNARIPLQRIQARLAEIKGTTFDQDRLLYDLGQGVGWYRIFSFDSKHDLTPKEKSLQVFELATLAEQLASKMDELNRNALAELDSIWWSRYTALHIDDWNRTRSTLKQTADALRQVHKVMNDKGGTRGRKSSKDRDTLLSNTVTLLLETSNPTLTLTAARELATDLILMCGVPLPADPNEVAKIDRRTSRGE